LDASSCELLMLERKLTPVEEVIALLLQSIAVTHL